MRVRHNMNFRVRLLTIGIVKVKFNVGVCVSQSINFWVALVVELFVRLCNEVLAVDELGLFTAQQAGTSEVHIGSESKLLAVNDKSFFVLIERVLCVKALVLSLSK